MAIDPFSTDSGFPTDYTGTVVDAHFEVPADERRGKNLVMVWKMQLDDPGLFPQADGGVWDESFGCGDGWETPDGGETAVFPGNPDKRFHSNSGYGQVITKAASESPEGFGIKGILLSRAESPTVAAIWKGLRFHIDALPYSFKDSDGNKVTGKKNYPVAYLGEGAGGGFVAANAAGYSADDLGISGELEAKMQAVATLADDWNSFLDSVIKLDGVKENDRLVLALAEEGYWRYLQGAEVM